VSVTRYRHVADMPPVARAVGADLARRIRAVWARSRRLAGVGCTPGVQKFSSLEAAQRARELEVQARMREIRSRRR